MACDFVLSQSCKNSLIIHGGYSSTYFKQYNANEFGIRNVESAKLIGFNILSQGDLAICYLANIK